MRLLLDGQPVGAAPTGSAVSFTSAKDLSQGKHTAAVEVADLAGNTARKEWSFEVKLVEFPWLIVIVLVILLAVAVGGYYWYTKMRAKPGAPPGGPPGGSPPG